MPAALQIVWGIRGHAAHQGAGSTAFYRFSYTSLKSTGPRVTAVPPVDSSAQLVALAWSIIGLECRWCVLNGALHGHQNWAKAVEQMSVTARFLSLAALSTVDSLFDSPHRHCGVQGRILWEICNHQNAGHWD